MMKTKSTEKATQLSILSYLEAKNIFHYRNNSGAMVSEYAGKKRFFRFGAAGSPDIICVIKGVYVGIECKDVKGELNDNQKAFSQALTDAGGVYLVARSLDDIIKFPAFQ